MLALGDDPPTPPALGVNGVIVHQGSSMLAARRRASAIGLIAEAPRSIGTWPPAAAATQEASRNSWLVATRSAALALTRSGSQAMILLPGGR